MAGRVDILVNNAGVIRRNDALVFTEEDWDIALDVNLKTPFFLAQAVAQALVKAGRGGKIINIASMLSFQGGIRTASYTASKSGLAGLTRLLANEWAARGINVNAIAPGYFETNNTTALRSDEQRNRDILGRIPAGRWGAPADLGRRGGVPGLVRIRLCPRHDPAGGRRLARPLSRQRLAVGG